MIKENEDGTITCGKLVWERRSNDGGSWLPVLPEGLKLSYFCVKDYGPGPHAHDPDSVWWGWMITSGGPFVHAGRWASRDEAIEGATPWLIERYRKDADEAIEAHLKVKAALEDLLKDLKP